MDKKEITKILHKLNRQFGHAPVERLKHLMKSAGTGSLDIFNMTDNKTVNCNTCTKYKKSSPSSVVGFSLASDFDQTVVVDLH